MWITRVCALDEEMPLEERHMVYKLLLDLPTNDAIGRLTQVRHIPLMDGAPQVANRDGNQAYLRAHKTAIGKKLLTRKAVHVPVACKVKHFQTCNLPSLDRLLTNRIQLKPVDQALSRLRIHERRVADAKGGRRRTGDLQRR